jgi:hypothetical protein
MIHARSSRLDDSYCVGSLLHFPALVAKDQDQKNTSLVLRLLELYRFLEVLLLQCPHYGGALPEGDCLCHRVQL